ncbi:hypothetical protein [Paenimyroides ceti]|jgi:hypothetical protein
MKKAFVFLFLFSFLYQSTSSFWIITSFYINQEYIAKNICINRFDAIPVCNGKCYLSAELKKDQDKEGQIPTIKTPEIQPLFHLTFIYEAPYHSFIPFPEKSYPVYQSEALILYVLSGVFQPPEIV